MPLTGGPGHPVPRSRDARTGRPAEMAALCSRPARGGSVEHRIGEILVAMKACTAQELQAALQTQSIFGGRLGTNLLELGIVDHRQLATALSRAHNIPCLADALGAWRDDRVEYFFGHPEEVVASGAIGMAFGAGASGQTTPDTDGGLLWSLAAALCSAGGHPLP